MSTLKTVEKQRFEDLLGMDGGYVLDFSNQSLATFFRETVGVDIYAVKYAYNGDSKARRLRAFWETESDLLVGKVLSELLDVWSYKNPKPDEARQQSYTACRGLAQKLLGKPTPAEVSADQFLKEDFGAICFDEVPVDACILPILNARFVEASRCLQSNAPLAAIFLSGSILEGLLLGVASRHPQQFNKAACSPKDDSGKVKQFPQWSLAQFIDAAHELGFLKLDVKKFSHALRDFRNYVHPYQQMSSGFNPDRHTAEICLQVLKAAVAGLSGERG